MEGDKKKNYKQKKSKSTYVEEDDVRKSKNFSQDSLSQNNETVGKLEENNISEDSNHNASDGSDSQSKKLNTQENQNNIPTVKDDEIKSQPKNSLDEVRIKSVESSAPKQNLKEENTKPENNHDEIISQDNPFVQNNLINEGGVSNQEQHVADPIESNSNLSQNEIEKNSDISKSTNNNQIMLSNAGDNSNDGAEHIEQTELSSDVEINTSMPHKYSEGRPNEGNIFYAKDHVNELIPQDFKNRKIQLFSYYNIEEWEEKLKNQKENPTQNYVTLNINEITDELEKSNEFRNENINLMFSNKFFDDENANDERVYLAHLTDQKFTYDGILNKNFEKNIIGKNKFANGDLYIGNWKNDKKDGFGVYYYNSAENDGLPEVFCGKFVDGGKKKEGFYFNSTGHEIPEGKFSFDAFEGEFDSNENLENGTFISLNKEVTKSYIYLGKFSENKKQDQNAYYYLFNSRLLFIGKFDNDNITQGHLFELTPEKQIKSFVRYNSSSGKREAASEVEMQEQINNANNFLSKMDSNKLIASVQLISQNCFHLEETWRNKKISSDDDIDILSKRLDGLKQTLTTNSMKL